LGIELKPSYYRQAVRNVAAAYAERPQELPLFASASAD
jgi:hypothetical protein